VFGRARVAVFVDGDYWHGRILVERGDRALAASFRTANKRFWIAKIRRNVKRDMRQSDELHQLGWLVIRVWEKDVLKNSEAIAERIVRRVRSRSG
jgi:DNA mismatch endonuclease, patch repair protein